MNSHKPKVLVLGSTGMLGQMVTKILFSDKALQVDGTIRSDNYENLKETFGDKSKFIYFDAEEGLSDIDTIIKGFDWVINCIGVIKPYIRDDNAEETIRAIKVNSLFPYQLAKAAERLGVQVIQIATDCVFSGIKGNYLETDPHDALDVYGKTKSLGEVHLSSIHHLRCSIIGPELKEHLSLLDWFLNQKKGAQVKGYTNHYWNGITTFHFAKICSGVIKSNIKLNRLQHIVPANKVTKYELLKIFAKSFDRKDVKIEQYSAEKVIDRTLSTEDASFNRELWLAAGYKSPPTIEKMVTEITDKI